jgi:phosphoribosylaminoimidazole-succinocarboxamide synthase
MITAVTSEIVARVPPLIPFAEELAGRSMLCRRAEVFPVECVVRGYLSGSAWKEYASSGTLAGERMPQSLRESDRLSHPLFTPATKAEEGHDENITLSRMAELVGRGNAGMLELLAHDIYQYGSEIAAERGIIVADTKLEFGRAYDEDTEREEIILVDEVLTPDSSRFWPADKYRPGGSQPSFDKQPLRDYLESERKAGRWNGNAPPPPLPPHVIEETSIRYRSIFEMLTGASLPLVTA